MKFGKIGRGILGMGLGIAALLSTPVHASLIVIPGLAAGVEQASPDSTPLGSDTGAYSVQQVYGTSLLGGLQVGDIIMGLTFRIDGLEGVFGSGPNSDLPAQTVQNYNIGLGQSNFGAGDLHENFLDNRGADFTWVRTGSLVINPGDFPGGSTPNAFGALIAFQTSYTYQGGPLLMEITHDGFQAGRYIDDTGTIFDQAPLVDGEQVFAEGYQATEMDLGAERQAFVVMFDVTRGPDPRQELPEPSGLNLFGAALACLMGVTVAGRRRKMRPARVRA